jgi:hypothetical protein
MSTIAEEDNNENKKEAPGARSSPTKTDPAAVAARSFLSAAIDMSVHSGSMDWNVKPKAMTQARELYNCVVLTSDPSVSEGDRLESAPFVAQKPVSHANSVHLPVLGNTPSPTSSIRSKHVIDSMFSKDVLLPRIPNGK